MLHRIVNPEFRRICLPSDRVDEVRGIAAGNKSRRFIFVYQYGNMGRAMSYAMGDALRN
jgi:hypothetical protein